LAITLLLSTIVEAAATKRTEILLYSFTGGPDGANPASTLIADAAGDLYGTTPRGGPYSQGVVFKLTPEGTLNVLYAFFGEEDGGQPRGGVIFDAAGNLYGTANRGGVNDAGVMFKIEPDGTEGTFYKFGKQQGDAENPVGDLIADPAGNFYGLAGGGAYLWGALYRITPADKEQVLYSFVSWEDGGSAEAGLVRDDAGNLFGTGSGGGKSSGAVFELAADGTESVLHSFNGEDGSTPVAPLFLDKKGALFGTTIYAGPNNRGVIFKIAPNGNETTVHAFNGTDGEAPMAGLISDRKGNLYGTTCYGGKFNGGTAYKLARDGTVNVIHSFGTKGRGPECPAAKLTIDGTGNLFGTTSYGGAYGYGSIFEIKK
jgi:uncharacterized repeat protein (TIGR03803 family)